MRRFLPHIARFGLLVLALLLALGGVAVAKPAARSTPSSRSTSSARAKPAGKAKPAASKPKPAAGKPKPGTKAKLSAADQKRQAAEQQRRAADRKACQAPAARKTARCKALLAADKDDPKVRNAGPKADGADKADPKVKKSVQGDDADADDTVKPLSGKEKKRAAQLSKECAGAKAKKSAKCKAFFAQQKERDAAAERARLKKTCAKKEQRKSKQCKAYFASQKKAQVSSICGRKYGRAKKNEPVARFARRYRVAEGTVRRLNDLGSAKKLVGGKRYLVYKSPHDGVVLSGGVLLEPVGEQYLLQRPHRAWGKPLLVDTLRIAIAGVQASEPLGTQLVVGDLSKEGGGCLPPHRSHRGGLDADIGYYMRGGRQRQWLGLATPETMDADRTWQLVRAFLATGRLQYAFIDHGLQGPLYEAALRAGETPESLRHVFQYPRPLDQAHETIIRHLGGHADHMHVRFSCLDPEACPLPEDTQPKVAAVRQENRGGVRHEPVARNPRARLRDRSDGVAVPLALP